MTFRDPRKRLTELLAARLLGYFCFLMGIGTVIQDVSSALLQQTQFSVLKYLAVAAGAVLMAVVAKPKGR